MASQTQKKHVVIRKIFGEINYVGKSCMKFLEIVPLPPPESVAAWLPIVSEINSVTDTTTTHPQGQQLCSSMATAANPQDPRTHTYIVYSYSGPSSVGAAIIRSVT